MDSIDVKIYGAYKAEVSLQFKNFFDGYNPLDFFTETTLNLMREVYKLFAGSGLSGSTVTDFSVGPNMAPLLAMKDFVQQITTVDMDAASVKEVEKWKNKDPDAFDWSNAVGILKDLKGNRDKPEDEQEDLRGKLKKPVYVDYNKGLNSLLLPKADIATSIWFLDCISKDHDEYSGNLRELCNLITDGGYVLMFSCLNCSSFNVGDIKYHYLKCDESFYRRVISEAGLDIKYFKKFDQVMSSDSVDNEGMVFIIAQKGQEPQEAS